MSFIIRLIGCELAGYEFASRYLSKQYPTAEAMVKGGRGKLAVIWSSQILASVSSVWVDILAIPFVIFATSSSVSADVLAIRLSIFGGRESGFSTGES